MKIEPFARRTLRGKRWHFRIRARNGEILAQSEGYRNKGDMYHTIALIRTEAPYSSIEEPQ